MKCLNPFIKFGVFFLLPFFSLGMDSVPTSQKILKVGSFSPGEMLDQEIEVVNDSGADWKIQECDLSCECMRTVSFPLKIKSKGHQKIRVQVLFSKAAEFSYEISLKMESGGDCKFLLIGKVISEKNKESLSNTWNPEEYFITRQLYEPESLLYVDPDALIQSAGQTDSGMVVDIRNDEDYETLRFPGALHIMRPALKTSSFLMGKKVVLMTYGYGNKGLEEEIQSLNQRKGWNIRILKGGILGWKMGGGRIEGALFQENLYAMDPGDFFFEKNNSRTLIVYSEKKSDKIREIKRWIPFALSEEEIKNTSLDSYDSIIRIDSNNDCGDFEKWSAGFQKSVYYVKGGLPAYQEYLKRIVAIRNERWKTVRTVQKKGCKSCP